MRWAQPQTYDGAGETPVFAQIKEVMMDEQLRKRYHAAVNRLAKWRTVLAGWQLGTRQKGDAESDAVRDHREATLVLRAEVTALAAVLVEKGVFTLDEFAAAVAREADDLNRDMERKFPGFKAFDGGIVINSHIGADTMRSMNWRD